MTPRFKAAILEATGERKTVLMQIYMARCFYAEAKKGHNEPYKRACRALIRKNAVDYRNLTHD